MTWADSSTARQRILVVPASRARRMAIDAEAIGATVGGVRKKFVC